jgi:hypothetical protein
MISAALAGTVALIAVATVVGAMAGRWSRRSTPVVATLAVGFVLLAVVVLDLVPDLVSEVAQRGRCWPAALVGGFGLLATGRFVRRGCRCQAGPTSNRPGVAIALAIGMHRAVEGSALVAVASIPLATALVLHSAGEGYALGTPDGESRQRVLWVAVACVSPLLGATALTALPLPDAVHPLLTALIAGVLARAALVALRSGIGRHASRPGLAGETC